MQVTALDLRVGDGPVEVGEAVHQPHAVDQRPGVADATALSTLLDLTELGVEVRQDIEGRIDPALVHVAEDREVVVPLRIAHQEAAPGIPSEAEVLEVARASGGHDELLQLGEGGCDLVVVPTELLLGEAILRLVDLIEATGTAGDRASHDERGEQDLLGYRHCL